MILRTVLRVLFLLIILFASNPSFAQQSEGLGNWMMYFGQNRFSQKFSWHTEVQYRNHDVLPEIEQLLLRTGINLHFADNALALIGYGYISSYDEEDTFSDPKTTEHRIYQELQLNQNVGIVAFNHRYRVEQRWVSGDYRSRFRYRIMATVPFTKRTDKFPFFAFYDEVFIAPGGSVFDRNRIYGALGYKFNGTTSVQAGLLNQQVGLDDKWYLQFAVFYNPRLNKT